MITIQNSTIQKSYSGRGFASMSPERRRKIASDGGRIAHETGRAHRWTSLEAQAAGRIGGKRSQKKRLVPARSV